MRLFQLIEGEEQKEMKTGKILAVIGALIAGGLGIALVSAAPQAAHAAMSTN